MTKSTSLVESQARPVSIPPLQELAATFLHGACARTCLQDVAIIEKSLRPFHYGRLVEARASLDNEYIGVGKAG